MFIYLFIWLRRAGSQLRHTGSSQHVGSFFFLVAACGIFLFFIFQLGHAGSLFAACGIQYPDQGLNLGFLHWELRTLTTGPPGKSLFYCLLFVCLCFWLHWVFIAVRGLSLVAGSGGYSSLLCTGFSLQWLLLLRSIGSRRTGFSSCSTWAHQLWLSGSGAQAQQLWHTGLVAPWHVGSSQTRARTHVPCIGRWILNHCATREVPYFIVFLK